MVCYAKRSIPNKQERRMAIGQVPPPGSKLVWNRPGDHHPVYLVVGEPFVPHTHPWPPVPSSTCMLPVRCIQDGTAERYWDASTIAVEWGPAWNDGRAWAVR